MCYDVTSISSYTQEMPSVERGYNRDGDDLTQFNLGMFCDENSKLSLYFNRYNGSLTDKTNLSYVMANAKAIGIKRVKMILDGGFWSEECLTSLHAICGVPGRGFLYYDSWNHVNLCQELSHYINRLKAELRALKRYPKSKLGRYTPYFVLTAHAYGSGFGYRMDRDKVEKLRKSKGYFLIFSTDRDAMPLDVLDQYRPKDADEKLFAQIKVEMDGKRMRTHNEETTNGKTFVTFIACVIRSYLLSQLANHLTSNSTSLKKVFSQLSNITIFSNSEGFRFAKALTKKQKQILSSLSAINHIASTLTAIRLR